LFIVSRSCGKAKSLKIDKDSLNEFGVVTVCCERSLSRANNGLCLTQTDTMKHFLFFFFFFFWQTSFLLSPFYNFQMLFISFLILTSCWKMLNPWQCPIFQAFLVACFLIYDVFILSQIIQLLAPVYIILWSIVLLLCPLYIPVQPALSSCRDLKLKLSNNFERQRVVDCTLLWILLAVGYSIGFENLLVWAMRIV
jgi:hypothetical protein